ncbi:hypothetical protein B0T26DRAFT_828372 [Lasiosphaeria miniovina]|uniref:Uncharacterized protein n=1 Tax=Lasiosphaeria miniovina TaxID=1954250 RepID=A0AA40DX59_9PEZI|nr:uncharacterized protein B0T26DRAFT_828372 [Lasiosphaeria miniovina]KAK0716887.1 hypothetical protein B0T26DRAFT_828372 [Lasiosphaeria miniovina]
MLRSSGGGKTLTRRQVLDGNQLEKLCVTLGRPPPPGLNPQLPPGYHLVYFTPSEPEAALGRDGSDRAFNAPAPFTRRMWAGGRMRWPSLDGRLRVGDLVEERTRLLGATAKRSRRADGSDMVLVDVEKEFWTERGLAVVDQRSWIFRREIPPEPTSPSSPPPPPPPRPLPSHTHISPLLTTKSSSHDVAAAPDNTTTTTTTTTTTATTNANKFPSRHLVWSDTGLFRFSALTFNAHKIHHSGSWARDVEGHAGKGVVVHGPLNLVCMMDYWRDIHSHGNDGMMCASEVSYRAVAPLYAGEAYRIVTASVQDRAYELRVERDGVVCMTGRVLARPASAC